MKKILITGLLVILSVAVFAQKAKRPLTREEYLNETYCSGLFSTTDGTYFDLENDNNTTSATGYLNVLDWLQGRVAGLQIYSYYNLRIPVIRNSVASLFVDEMRVDANFLNSLPITDIAMIKIIKTPFLGNWGGAGGAIAIYTKSGEEEEKEN